MDGESGVPPNTLALDLGTTTGWAVGRSHGAIISGVWNLKPGRFESQSMRLIKLEKALNDIHAAVPIARVFYEEVRRHMSTDAAHWYGAFWGHVIKWADEHGIPYEGVPVQTIKKYATGKGNAKKDDVIAAMRALGHEVADDNEADAVALLRLKIEDFAAEAPAITAGQAETLAAALH